MAGIEDQVREMEQRLAAQFQQQLLQAQEGQRLQLETLTQLVTQQRVAGAGLEQQVAAQRLELGTQQREGQGLPAIMDEGHDAPQPEFVVQNPHAIVVRRECLLIRLRSPSL